MIESLPPYTLHRDSNGESYLTIASGDHDETYRIFDTGFARRLAGDFFTETGKTISLTIIQDLLAVLDAIAQRSAPCEISIRYARADSYLYIDLGRKMVNLRLSGWLDVVEIATAGAIHSTGSAMGELPFPYQQPDSPSKS